MSIADDAYLAAFVAGEHHMSIADDDDDAHRGTGKSFADDAELAAFVAGEHHMSIADDDEGTGKSFADDAELAAFVGGDYLPELRHVTRDAVETALKGFALPLVAGKDMDWLTMAVRRSLAMCEQHISEEPEREPNAAIKAELERLGAELERLGAELKGPGAELERLALEASAEQHARIKRVAAIKDHLFSFAYGRWDGTGGKDVGNGMVLMGTPAEYERFTRAIEELDWASRFLRDAAEGVEEQRHRWRQAERRRQRVRRGYCLARVFEVAFGRTATVNDCRTDARYFKKPTPFMTFYERMVTLAFPKDGMFDLPGVLREALSLHRQSPFEPNPELIPGL
jgi:hypothetical protein